MSLADVADLLACPACAARDLADRPLTLEGTTLRCAEGHAYDVARQGHVNLLGRAVPRNADGAEMVAARERFLGSGAYDRVGAALADAVRRATGRRTRPPSWTSGPDRAGTSTGCWPGWPTTGGQGAGVALDVSPVAARRAARSPWRVGAVVADAWARLPVRTAAVDVALSVFAPRQPAELARVLAPGGSALVVSPLPEHLAALREEWGLLDVEPGKQERLAATFGAHLRPRRRGRRPLRRSRSTRARWPTSWPWARTPSTTADRRPGRTRRPRSRSRSGSAPGAARQVPGSTGAGWARQPFLPFLPLFLGSAFFLPLSSLALLALPALSLTFSATLSLAALALVRTAEAAGCSAPADEACASSLSAPSRRGPRVAPPRPRRVAPDSLSTPWTKPYERPVSAAIERMLSPPA